MRTTAIDRRMTSQLSSKMTPWAAYAGRGAGRSSVRLLLLKRGHKPLSLLLDLKRLQASLDRMNVTVIRMIKTMLIKQLRVATTR